MWWILTLLLVWLVPARPRREASALQTEMRFPAWGPVAAHPALSNTEVRCREGAPSSDGTLVAIEASIYTASALQMSAAIYTVTGTNSYAVLAEAGTGQAASVGLNRIAMPPTPITAGTTYAVCIRTTGTSGGMNSGSAAGTEETTRYCNASVAAFPAFPSALTCSLHFGLSDFVAGVYTPNVANEARFGSTMTGTPTWAGLIDTVCRSGVPLSSGTLQRIEARIRVIGGGSGHQVRMALYASAAGGAPSALLAQSGTPVNVAAADQVYPSPLTAHLTAGTRYWLCLRANNGDVESAFVSLPGEGAIDFTQATGTFAAGFNPAFTASLYPSNGDEHIAGVYTPDNVPGAGRALIIGGGVF